MTEIISGATLGLFGSSNNNLLGNGSAGIGRFGERAFINSVTGNLVLQNQDELLVGLGPDAVLVRTYNSQGLFDDDNGDNWRLNLASLLDIPALPNTAGSTITKRFGDGAQIGYVYDPTLGLYISSAGDGADDSLSYDSGNRQWNWMEGSSRVAEIYDDSGQLSAVRDADGNVLNYSYTGALLTRITDASGQEIHLDYTGNNLTKIRTVSGGVEQTKTSYQYDSSDRLSRVIVDLSPDDDSIADGNTYVTTYTYDGVSGRVDSITQGDGSYASFTYDAQGRIETYTDGEGRICRVDYVSATETRFIDPLGQVTVCVSDAAGRLTRIVNPAGLVSKYVYDAKSNLRNVEDGLGRAIVMEYDASDNLILTRDALGNTVTRRYNAVNQLIAETQHLIPDPDGDDVAAAGTPLTTRYVYDNTNHLRFVVSAEGSVVEHRYDASGNRIAMLQYSGGYYDLTGLSSNDGLTETQLASWTGSQDRTRWLRTDYSYDPIRGQLNKTTRYAATDSSGAGVASGASVTQYVYDQRGQLLQTLDARSSVQADAARNDLPYATTYTYDGLGRVTSAIEWVDVGDMRSSLSVYDDANRSVRITLANGLATTSTYDRRGLLTSIVQSSGANTLGTTRYQYDAAGRLRITTDPTGVKTYALYDDANRCVATVDGTGAVVETVYDDINNVVTTKAHATRLNSAQLAGLTVNGEPTPGVSLASLSLQSSADDRSRYQIYDPAHRLAIELETTDDVSVRRYVTKYFYDGAGRVTDVVQYANSVDVSTPPTLTGIEALISPSGGDRQQRRFYDGDGKLAATLDAEGYLAGRIYDAAGNLIETVAYAKSVARYAANWTLDAAATQTLRRSGTFSDVRDNVLDQDVGPDDQHQHRFYNGKAQLVAMLDAENYLTEYAYDDAGNAIRQTRYFKKARTYSGTQTIAQLRPTNLSAQVTQTHYNGANQVDEVVTNPAGTVTKYRYDDVGNLVQTDKAWNTNDVRSTRNRYDVQGRVVQELTGEGSAALDSLLAGNPVPTAAQIDSIWTSYSFTHTYDQAGRRASTTDQNGNKTLFYYDGDGQLIYTVNALGEVSQTTYTAFGQVHEQSRYANAIDTTNLVGGLAGNDVNFTTRVAAINVPAEIDTPTRINYTLRGAVRDAIDASYVYNRFGELESEKPAIDGATIVSTGYRYDKRGLLLQTTQDEGGLARVISTQYDAFGRAIQTTDARGIVSATTYDRLGRTVTTTIDPAVGSGGLNLRLVIAYDALGRMLTQTDALGKITSYLYDDMARSFTLTTPEGISTTSVSNRHGEIVSVSDGAGNVTTYEYDKNGQLSDTTQSAGAPGLLTSSEYDHAQRKISATDANGTVTRFYYDDANRLLTRVVDEGGLNLRTSYQYEGQGRKLAVTDANGVVTETSYDINGRMLDVVVDLNGERLHTSYAYDKQGRTLTVTEGAGSTRPRITQYTYDKLGRRIYQVDDAGTGGLAIASAYSYDANDNLVAKTQALGKAEQRKTRYVYDAHNRLVYTVDALGVVVANEYDKNGRIGKTVRYASAISLNGLTDTLSTFDIATRLVVDPYRDQATRCAYDGDGRLVFTADAMMNVVERQYDNTNRVTQTTRYANVFNVGAFTDVNAVRAQCAALADPASDQTTRTVYDAAGRAVFSIDALNYVTETTFDANGNAVCAIAYARAIVVPSAVSLINLRAAVDTITDSARDRVTRHVYDSANRERYTIDVLGFVKAFDYDAVGHVKTTIVYYDPVATSGLPAAATQDDILNALAIRTAPSADLDQTTMYAYDGSGRLDHATDAQDYAESYTYDDLGNKIGLTNKKGKVWTYEYDGLGRLAAEITPKVSVTRVDANTVATTTDESITTRMTYDAFGNVKTRTEAFGTPEARTTTYDYDLLGHQIRTTFPPVGVYAAAADAARGYVGRNETSQTLNSLIYYDVLGNAIAAKSTSGVFSYKIYDALGRIKYEIDAERYVTEHGYDAFGNSLTTTRYATALSENLFVVREAGATSTSIQGFSIGEMAGAIVTSAQDRTITNQYDRRNQVAKILQPRVGNYDGSFGSSFTANPTTINTYNAFGQVVKQSSLRNPGPDSAVGNADDTWIDTCFYYDEKGQRTAQIDALGYLSQYAYDASGNLVLQTEYAAALAYGSWNTGTYGAPLATTPIDANSVSAIGFDRTTKFGYDRLNRKLTETRVNVQYSSATYTGVASLTALLGDLTTRYTYDAVGNLTSVTDPKGNVSYSYYDALGRTVAVAEPSRISDSVGSPALPPLSVNALALNKVAATKGVFTSGSMSPGSWSASAIDLGWSSLAQWGAGTVRVRVDYTAGIAGQSTTNTFLDQILSAADADTGFNATWTAGTYGGLVSINRVQVWKVVDGAEVQLFDSPGTQIRPAILTWSVAPVQGTVVKLTYHARYNPGKIYEATIENGLIQVRGSRYWIDLSARSIDLYDYVLTYSRPGETTPYAQGTGTFAVVNTNTVETTDVAGFVEEPVVDLVGFTSGVWVPSGYSGTTGNWTANTIDLKWSSLAQWGTGDVHVYIYYDARDRNGSVSGYYKVDRVLSADSADTGCHLSWDYGTNADAFGGIESVRFIDIWKNVGGGSVRVFNNSVGDKVVPERLILIGRTTNVTGVVIKTADYDGFLDPRTIANGGMTNIGFTANNDPIYAVDVSDLVRGRYSYGLVGTGYPSPPTKLWDFEVKGGQTWMTFSPIVQESTVALNVVSSTSATYAGSAGWTANVVNLAWSPLAQWGSGNVRLRIDYTAGRGAGNVADMADAYAEITLSAADAFAGYNFSWNKGGSSSAFNALRSINRVQLWKVVNGVEIKLVDSAGDTYSQQLMISCIPSETVALTLEYRKRGTTDSYQLKSATRLVTGAGGYSGWFAANYDDIANGVYDYRITLLDANGQPISSTYIPQGQVTGTMRVLRGGQNLPTISPGASSVFTPLTTIKHDIFGNAVQQTRLANGAATANAATFIAGAADMQLDQRTVTYFDAFGHLVNSVDAEGTANYMSYDAAGNIAKKWHALTNADGASAGLMVELYTYDRLGRQTSSTTTSTMDHKDTGYNAFGEIVSKGLNGGAQEYYRYDNAGRLWQTNKDDGVARAYLYDLQGRVTAALDSVTIDLHSYSDASSLGVLTGGVRRTETYYDSLGRVVRQVQPTAVAAEPVDVFPQALSVSSLVLNVSTTSGAWTTSPSGAWSQSTINLAWNSLTPWGNGNVRVRVDYTAKNASGATTATFQERISNPMLADTGYSYSWSGGTSSAAYGALKSVDRVQVWKVVDGVEVKLFDSNGGDQVAPAILTWPVAPVPGTVVTLSYRPKYNPMAKYVASTTDGSIQVRGSRYWVDLGNRPIDLYDYIITYMRPVAEATPYATGTGSFAIANTNAAGGINIVGFVEEPALSHTITSGNWTTSSANPNGGWSASTIDVNWTSLAQWGAGNVRVRIEYSARNSAGAANNNAVVDQSNLSAADVDTGFHYSWNSGTSGAAYGGINYVNRVQVWKNVGGADIMVFDRVFGPSGVYGPPTLPERLILNGDASNYANLTGVTIKDASGNIVDTRTLANGKMTSIGRGVYAVNVSDLARGTYTYTPIGSGYPVPWSFQVKGSQSLSARPAIQESALGLSVVSTGANYILGVWAPLNSIKLSWSPLTQWGAGDVHVRIDYTVRNNFGQTLSTSVDRNLGWNYEAITGFNYIWPGGMNSADFGALQSVNRIQVWKVVDGVEVKLFDGPANTYNQQLMISGIPASAATLKFEYRKSGTSAYQVKTTSVLSTTAGATNRWFSANYDDLPNGSYDYRLTAFDAGGQVVGLMNESGVLQGQLTGSMNLTRGGQLLIAAQQVSRGFLPTPLQTLDRWGNVLAVTPTGTMGMMTNYRYDYLNHVVEKDDPVTEIWDERGANRRMDARSDNDRPISRTYYDALGLAIATVDPNGNLEAKRYDEVGHVVGEYHADGGLVKHSYDIFGREIRTSDANGNITTSVYNRNNQLAVERTPISSMTYVYDEEGHRIRVTNGMGETTRYLYDQRGNLVQTRSPMGAAGFPGFPMPYSTVMTYDAFGRKLIERNGNFRFLGPAGGDSQSWTYNYFGKVQTHTDLGGAVTVYTYDTVSGRLLRQQRSGGVNPGQDISYDYYENGTLRRAIDNALGMTTAYVYDAAGQKIREQFLNSTTGEMYQDTRTTYDELGRIYSVGDLRYNLQYAYDANGNRRSVRASYIDNAGSSQVQNYWYLYNSMNRITLSQGQLVSGQIAIGATQGIQLSYDANGNRRIANFYENGKLVNESYNFDAQNRLAGVIRGGVTNSSRTYDAAGRVVDYINYSSAGVIKDTQHSTYNANGWITSSVTRDASNQVTQTLTYSAYDSVGNVLTYSINVAQGTPYTNTYTKSYIGLDSYRESTVHATSTTPALQPGDTIETYDVNGNLVHVEDHFNANKSRDLVVTTQGQVLKKREDGKTEYYFYANGNPIGNAGDVGGANANFDYNYTAVSDQYPSSTPNQYTVSRGDTLQGIALAVYGDARLWYFIADANGLKGDGSDLLPGQMLTIPNGITNLHNSSATHRVYAPGEIIGSTAPTLPNTPSPPPPEDKRCAVATVIIVAIVVAALVTAGVATLLAPVAATLEATAIVAGLAGGAAGSIASQLTSMAFHLTDKFSWEEVAIDAVISGITAGASSWVGEMVSPVAQAATATPLTIIIGNIVKGMVGNAVNQGLNILIERQSAFNWGSFASVGLSALIPTDRIKETNWVATAAKTVFDAAKTLVLYPLSHDGKIDPVSLGADIFGNILGNSLAAATRDAIGGMYQAIQDQQDQKKMDNLTEDEAEQYKYLSKINRGADRHSLLKAIETFNSEVAAGNGMPTLKPGETIFFDSEMKSAHDKTLLTPGKTEADAFSSAKLVEVRRVVDRISDHIKSLFETDPGNPQLMALCKTREVFTCMLVSQDSYYDGEGISDILPRGVQRVTNNSLLTLTGKRADFFRDDRIGYFAALYENKNTLSGKSEYILANRGSEPFWTNEKIPWIHLNDWVNNIAQAIGLKTEQYDKAVSVADALKARFGDSLIFTGHSLGGGLAAAQAFATGNRAVTFDAASLNQDTIEQTCNVDIDPKRLITSYNVDGEFLSGLQDRSVVKSILSNSFSIHLESAQGTRVTTPVIDFPGLKTDAFTKHYPYVMLESLCKMLASNDWLPYESVENIQVR